MNERIIVQNDTDKPTPEILDYVKVVMQMGKISNDNTQYCYATRFKDGIIVAAIQNKASVRFIVYSGAGK